MYLFIDIFRISLLLRDAHGNNWRDFLPTNSDIDRVKAGLAEMSLPTPQVTPPTPQVTPPKPEEKGGAPLPPNIPMVTSTVSSGSDTSLSQSTSTLSSTVHSSFTGSSTATDASSADDRKKEFEESKSKGNEFVKQVCTCTCILSIVVHVLVCVCISTVQIKSVVF